MKKSVTFYFSCPNLNKRFSCIVIDYPYKPTIGDEVSVPIYSKEKPNEHIHGKIAKVVHNPMSCYFSGVGCEIDCDVRLSHEDMEFAWDFLSKLESEGRKTHQWSNWNVYTI